MKEAKHFFINQNNWTKALIFKRRNTLEGGDRDGVTGCFVKLHCIINSMVRMFLWCVLVTFYYHQVHNAGGLPFNPSADKGPK